MVKINDRTFLTLAMAFGLGPLALTGCGDDESANGTENADGSGTESESNSGVSTSDTAATMSMSGSGTGTSGSTEADTEATASGSTAADTDSSASGSTTGSGSGSTSTGDAGSDTESTSGSSGSSTTAGEESGSTTTGGNKVEICEAPGELESCDSDTLDPFEAMGLGCPFGPNAAIPIYNEVFSYVDDSSWRIARQFGTYIDPGDGLPLWRAREGEQFLIISSGQLSAPDAAGIITMASGVHDGDATGDTDNLDDRPLPAPMSALRGSNGGAGGTPFLNCDFVNDCSDSLNNEWIQGGGEANDLLWFQFEVAVPGGTHGFSFDFAYFSGEFPEFVDTIWNDIFAVWSNSETYTGNLCFVNDQPCTVTALWPIQHQANDPALAGTGFEPSGGTGWFQAKGSVEPGELLQLTFAVFDMSDSIYDTAVILDNFQWDCEGCTPSEVDPCIGIDPV